MLSQPLQLVCEDHIYEQILYQHMEFIISSKSSQAYMLYQKIPSMMCFLDKNLEFGKTSFYPPKYILVEMTKSYLYTSSVFKATPSCYSASPNP